MSSIRKNLKKFILEQSGAIILLYALALIPIMGMVGISIDAGRIYYVNAILTGAVDAAAIAGGKAGGTKANITQKATDIFNANIPKNFIATITGPKVTLTNNDQTISVNASAQINTTFMKILGQTAIATTSTSAAQVSNPGTEIVLALDNTGSMSGSPMQGEIAAAQLLVQTVYGGAGVDTVPGLYFAVVPYTTAVNINMAGFANPSSWLTSAGVTQIANTNLYPNIAPTATSVGGKWMGCIEARTPPIYTAGMDISDTPPTSDATRFTPYLYPSTMVHKYVMGTALDRTNPLGAPPWGGSGSTRGDNDWKLDGTVPGGSGLHFGDNYQWVGSDGNLGVGPNLGCPIPILPLTASQTTVQQTISNMKATFRGGTMINVGLVAAWWTISPNWVGLWPTTPPTLPQAYGSTKKFLVLMTDGMNQWYDWPTGVPGAPDSSHNYSADADYTGYGRLAEGRSGTTNAGNTVSVLNTRMANMCQTLKDNGVVVYTILFTHGGTIDSGTQSLFQNCATDPSKYFLSATNGDLITAFQNIGKSISSLRLTWLGKP